MRMRVAETFGDLVPSALAMMMPVRGLWELSMDDAAELWPFEGTIPFDITIGMVGLTIWRKARVVFKASPDFEYLDCARKKLRKGTGIAQYEIEVLGASNDSTAKLEWFGVADLISEQLLETEGSERFRELIEEECRRIDSERRAKFNSQACPDY